MIGCIPVFRIIYSIVEIAVIVVVLRAVMESANVDRVVCEKALFSSECHIQPAHIAQQPRKDFGFDSKKIMRIPNIYIIYTVGQGKGAVKQKEKSIEKK